MQKRQNSAGQNEGNQSDTSAVVTKTTENDTTHPNLSGQQRWMLPAAITVLKHTAVFLAFSIPIGILALVIKVPTWYAMEAEYWATNSFTHCNFNGEFTPLDKPTVGLWDSAGFFYITVSWGQMAFSTAKFIDIVWDIVVGRGGQAILALTTFKVSSQYLAMAMREAPVSYNTFEALAFVPPTVVRTTRLAGDLLTNRGWRARLIIVWIILSSLFVLSFSSWITTMSGYSSNIEAVMPNHENESVMWSNFAVVQFAINDAQRIGHHGPLFITAGETCVLEGFMNDDDEYDGKYDDDETSSITKHRQRDNNVEEEGEDADGNGNMPWEYVPSTCSSFWRTVQYVSNYGLGGSNATESTITLNGTTHNIAAPALNITTSYSPAALSTLAIYLATFSESSTPIRDLLGSVSQLSDNTFWVYDNETYPFSYVRDNAACQYSKWHNWGFSFLFLFIASLLLAIWSTGTYALWLYVQLHTPYDQGYDQNSTPGLYRSSFTLVEAVKRDVGPGAVKPSMNEREIRDLVRRRRGRVISGVGNIDDYSPSILSKSEKHEPVSHSTTSSYEQYPARRRNGFRTWLSPSSYARSRHAEGVETPTNSVFTHVDSTYSSASQHPILQWPAAPSRSMTMTSHLSLASPFTDSPPEFGFIAAEESNVLDSSQIAILGAGPVSGIPVNGQTCSRKRPWLSPSRAIRSSTLASAPHTATLISASSSTGKWAASPGPVMPSGDSITTMSPVRQDDAGKRKDDEDAIRWKNDLGGD